MSSKSFEFRPSGSIEFDLAEPEPAPAPAGDGAAPAEAAPGLETDPLSIVFGRAKDTRVNATERMLAGATIDWLIGFPAAARPKTLCDRYPHVANRLASAWTDRTASLRSLELLATDARWGSVGYPALVQVELQRLRQHLAETA